MKKLLESKSQLMPHHQLPINSSVLYQQAKTKVKAKKSQSNDAKEIRIAFEKIASTLVAENLKQVNEKIETYCMDFVSQKFSELRQFTIDMDASISAKQNIMEARLNHVSNKVDDFIMEYKQSSQIQKNEFQKLVNEVEVEKQKRQNGFKKLVVKDEQYTKELNHGLQVLREEVLGPLHSLQGEIRSQNSEMNRIRDNMDQMLLKRYGYIPNSKGMEEHQPEISIDKLNKRIQSVENQLLLTHTKAHQDAKLNRSFEHIHTFSKYDNIEREIHDIQTKINIYDKEFMDIRSLLSSSTSHGNIDELHNLQKKMKKLADSTSKALRSFSGGIMDLQQAALNLYTWSDSTYNAFGIVCNKLNFEKNICPRVKVYNPKIQEHTYMS